LKGLNQGEKNLMKRRSVKNRRIQKIAPDAKRESQAYSEAAHNGKSEALRGRKERVPLREKTYKKQRKRVALLVDHALNAVRKKYPSILRQP